MDRDLALPRYGLVYRLFGVVAAVWVTVVLVLGIAAPVTNLPILEQTARNLYFHVPMWFVLYAGAVAGAWHAGRYLATGREVHDVRSEAAWRVSTAAGVIALVTGILWARFTWYVGTNIWWNGDPRQTMVAVQLLISGAYFVLRGQIDRPRTRARLSAVYALFATATMPFLTYVLPRRLASLHPGAEGNPAFSQMDIAPQMRWVFYAAAAGFLMLAWWIYTQRVRARVAELRVERGGADAAPALAVVS
ncbi:cytochrome C assembly protein [Rubrivirga sp. S365]|uniref:Cytochrome C assembly protein n=1 Tax=Rubrivirga litoralis TaxID=3075598 RepID=A0ABU3BVC5_9BACT|nr:MULTISPECIES: cytochrome c biogenesis protein CcsA [unclassified Rubrivirga]MDT0633239.1 cytochrome C assembly protein [Rubrivirga sp. F394]MDT7855121.1 cytochrome C assembly protein [Rubrivirga sp. S365]